MASTIISPLFQTLSLRRAPPTSCKAHASKPALAPRTATVISNRRQLLFLLTASTALTSRELPSVAEDIPLFGFRKKLKKAEEEAEEIVKEGFEAAERGLVTAEKGIVTAERGIETVESEIETALSFGGLAQAGVVAGAEFVGVLVATSIVNGILGPEAQNS
uniref:Synechocystis YCF37 n=1 Tax=Fagus sylvatica TaxID=28930 RepID=A0A2N9IEZ3_FAGSY